MGDLLGGDVVGGQGRGRGGAGDLDPLDENLLEPARVFANELRVLFQGLDTSMRIT
ncbi:hypothetical protein [Streptomyces sp. NPDC058861]|uniref:hypothetical protein n=1 Tax=Streptomyces sp. NPDC058861 TaxID=3346653 RepID=UPI00369C583B